MRKQKYDDTIPDFQAAGRTLAKRIQRQWFSPSRWLEHLQASKRDPCSESSIRGLCNGHYNGGQGATLSLLWMVAVAIAEGDEDAARLVMLEYMIASKVVPRDTYASVRTDLGQAQIYLKRAKQSLDRIAVAAQVKAQSQ